MKNLATALNSAQAIKKVAIRGRENLASMNSKIC